MTRHIDPRYRLALACTSFVAILAACGSDAATPLDATVPAEDAATPQDGAISPDGGTCNASNCEGCCRDGVCLSGRTPAACGKPGAACESCSGLTNCVERECKPTECGPNNCTGCCASGVCVGGDTASTCGQGGAACASCGSGAVCTDGTCVSTTCQASCTSGCCAGSTCNPGNTATACGKAGGACTACGAGRTCVAGGCATDVNKPFDLVIVSAAMPATNKAGAAWDVGGGLPDPYVKVTAGARVGESPFVPDTASPTWSFIALSNVPGRDLQGAVTLEVWDDDLTTDDFMGGCALRLGDPDFSGALRSGTCAASPTGVAFTFSYKLVPK